MNILTTANNEGMNLMVDEMDLFFRENKDKEIKIEGKVIQDIRTEKQNRAIHKWFTMIAKELNDNGHTITLSSGKFHGERKFRMEDVKEIFRIIMRAAVSKESTARLTKQELSECQEPFFKCLADNWQIYIPFPNENEINN